MTDIRMNYDTDLNFESDDLMLTSGRDYIELEVYKLLITEQGEWKASPKIGCSPQTFIGAANTRDTAKQLEAYLKEGLSFTVYPAQVDIKVVPTGYTNVMIFIDISHPDFDTDSVIFEFDFVNGIRKFNKIDERVTPPQSSDTYKLNDISNMKRPNQYWSSIREQNIS
jgi:hypothetical protein